MIFGKTVRNINRIGNIINILIKYSFEDIVSNTSLRKFVSAKKQFTGISGEKHFIEYTRWERIRMVIEELGPTTIKLAQFLSNRPDILPDSLIVEFTKLQNNVPPFSSITAKQIIEAETGKKIEELFSYFDNYTIGSGSIGQVHRAKLITGEDVVVKVQRPEAVKTVKTDLSLLREFVKLTESYFINAGILNPMDIVDNFEDSILQELDYSNEARSVLQFRALHKFTKWLVIPKPFRNISSTKVLILEFTSGCKITDYVQYESWGINRHEIAKKLIQIYLIQIFRSGIFHADPHPGNIFVTPAGKISLLDYGMVGKLTNLQKKHFSSLLAAIATRDSKKLLNSLQNLIIKSEINDIQIFENDLQQIIDEIIVYNVDNQGIKELVISLQRIIYKYKLQIPGSVFLLLRALAILEGVVKQLYPELDLLNYIKPYAHKVAMEQFSPQKIKSELKYSAAQLYHLLHYSPIEISYILRKIRTGDIHVKLEHQGYKVGLKKVDTTVNRLIAAILIASLIMGSSILTVFSPAHMPTILSFPVAGLLGFAMAIILGIWMVIYAMRHRVKKVID